MKDKLFPDMQTQLVHVMHMIEVWCYFILLFYIHWLHANEGSDKWFCYIFPLLKNNTVKFISFSIEYQHQMYIKCHVYYLWSI